MTADPRTTAARRELARLGREVARGAALALLVALPAAVRLACIGAAVGGAAWAFGQAWQAFGGDALALLPAAALTLAPAAWMLASRLGWGGLVVAALAACAVGAAVQAAGPVVRALAVVAVVGACVLHFVGEKQDDIDAEQER